MSCCECGGLIVSGRFVYSNGDDLGSVLCFGCYGEIPAWAIVEV